MIGFGKCENFQSGRFSGRNGKLQQFSLEANEPDMTGLFLYSMYCIHLSSWQDHHEVFLSRDEPNFCLPALQRQRYLQSSFKHKKFGKTSPWRQQPAHASTSFRRELQTPLTRRESSSPASWAECSATVPPSRS